MPPAAARPPAQLLAWVEQILGRGARVVGWKRLTGGLTSIVHRVTVERNGRREDYVLRWWVPDSEWEHWIARAVPPETAVLTKLEGTQPFASTVARVSAIAPTTLLLVHRLL